MECCCPSRTPLVVVLLAGATSLLYWLLRRGAASAVVRLFHLAPAVTAVMAYLLFEEPVTLLAVAGMALIAAGVLLARPPYQAPAAGVIRMGVKGE